MRPYKESFDAFDSILDSLDENPVIVSSDKRDDPLIVWSEKLLDIIDTNLEEILRGNS